MSSILYCYGTLRPGGHRLIHVPNLKMYDLGWFPGVIPVGDPSSVVVLEAVEVDDWRKLDLYEGFNPDDYESSLYIRTSFQPSLAHPKGYLYVYNKPIPEHAAEVVDGDWLAYTDKKKGINSDHFARNSASLR